MSRKISAVFGMFVLIASVSQVAHAEKRWPGGRIAVNETDGTYDHGQAVVSPKYITYSYEHNSEWGRREYGKRAMKCLIESLGKYSPLENARIMSQIDEIYLPHRGSPDVDYSKKKRRLKVSFTHELSDKVAGSHLECYYMINQAELREQLDDLSGKALLKKSKKKDHAKEEDKTATVDHSAEDAATETVIANEMTKALGKPVRCPDEANQKK